MKLGTYNLNTDSARAAIGWWRKMSGVRPIAIKTDLRQFGVGRQQ
jgi:hypothetical protein